MRIDGEWLFCDDGVLRPIVRGEVLNSIGIWKQVIFLVDTGADCTVISAAVAESLGFNSSPTSRTLGGVGGTADSVEIATQIRLFRDDRLNVIFRGQFGAMTRNESLDISVLGRGITNLFAVIVDRPGNLVALFRPPHHYLVSIS
jgi:hypothetical protein